MRAQKCFGYFIRMINAIDIPHAGGYNNGCREWDRQGTEGWKSSLRSTPFFAR